MAPFARRWINIFSLRIRLRRTGGAAPEQINYYQADRAGLSYLRNMLSLFAREKGFPASLNIKANN